MAEKGESELSIMKRSEPDGAPNQSSVSLLSFTMTSTSPCPPNGYYHPNLSSPSQNASKESSFSSDKSVSPIMSKNTLVTGSGQEMEFGTSGGSSPLLLRSRGGGNGDVGIQDEEMGVSEDTQGSVGPVEYRIRPGEFVMRVLFAEFTSQAEKKIESVMTEPPVSVRKINKLRLRRENKLVLITICRSGLYQNPYSEVRIPVSTSF